jgi:hypothetical protein
MEKWACTYRLYDRFTDVVVVDAKDYDGAAVSFLRWAKRTNMFNKIALVGIVHLQPVQEWITSQGNTAMRKVFPDGSVG